MCGILVGISKPNQCVCHVLDLLQKRGPDNQTAIVNDNYFIGFARLNVINDLKESRQPIMRNDDILVCNGEIYNHEELNDNHDLQCTTGSDCECILPLCKKFGPMEAYNKLDGVFAAIVITPTKLYILRDRVGVRPMYYGRCVSGDLMFASTVGALLPQCSDIKQVNTGVSIYDKYTCELKHIGNGGYPMIKDLDDVPEMLHNIRTKLIAAVSKRLMTSRPIACMLSGGLDSSLLTSIMCRLVGSENVRTYSIGMVGSTDTKYAKLVANFLGTKHTEINFTADEGINSIESVIFDMETDDVTTIRAGVPMWILAKHISTNTDDIVVMSGEGSDELFGGYLYFHHSPDDKSFEMETYRLVNGLHEHDVLRTDKCISSHGLEPRVPFLDKEFVNYVLSIPGKYRKPKQGVEKYLLRDAFRNGFLPDSVIQRTKDGFSDGVSGPDEKWYEQIQKHLGGTVENEAEYYTKVLQTKHKGYKSNIPRWLPRWVDHKGEPSGRNITLV
jgi:asparagine synthase (glutamine-hydrolysing)